MTLDARRQETLERIIDGVLTDVFYTFLLGLDGAASLGEKQVVYRLYDEEENELTGELEGLAWEHFYGKG
ncbi:hypothetical protein BH24DEI2_BH24DEI2_03930 [soil metagenome]